MYSVQLPQVQKLAAKPSDRERLKSLYNRPNHSVKGPINNRNKHVFNTLDMKYLTLIGFA
jgi:hypothetical protein